MTCSLVEGARIQMPSNTSSLLARKAVADNTLAVHFAKPPGFEFRAGQYIDIVLTSSPFHDLWGDLRTFSIASAPFEDHLEFVMRLSTTAFKRALSILPIGTTVTLNGPAGNFQLDSKNSRPAVFLAGGSRHCAIPQHASAGGARSLTASVLFVLFESRSVRFRILKRTPKACVTQLPQA